MEKDSCRGAVYLTVLCDRPYLVSLLFAVLLSLHLVTFFIVFITCIYRWILAWGYAISHLYVGVGFSMGYTLSCLYIYIRHCLGGFYVI